MAVDEKTLGEVQQEAEALKGRKAGIAVWRVKQLTLERVKDEDVGTFFKGDCYVIVSMSKCAFYIHYWLGSDSSQDEQAFAAMATVDIDDSVFGGTAIQVREINGCDKDGKALETPRFLKMFDGNYLIKAGGYKTALRKMSISNEPAHLYKVKGKLRPVVSEVLSRTSSLNSDDSFILDVSRKYKRVFVLHGKKCNKDEGKRAIQMARKFGVKTTVLDENEIGSCDEEENRILHDSLGVSRSRPVKFEGMDRSSDEEHQQVAESKTELFRVHDNEIFSVDIKQSSLDSGDCFVLKTAANVYVWKGRNSSKDEKRGAITLAEEFIRQKGLPANTQITIVPENIEPVDFKSCFAIWREKDETTKHDFSKPVVQNNVAKSIHTVIDFRALYDKPKPKEKKDPLTEDDVDGGRGKKSIYRIKPEGRDTGDERILERNDGFVFNSGESYVIVYQYRSKRAGKEKAIIYFWIGNDSEQKEHGAAALVASNIDAREFHDDAIQIRVTEAKEPPHFMKIFGGFIMIKQPHFADDGPRLFHIRGKEGNIKVVEVAVRASNLNSNDCFVLKASRKKVFIWLGKGSLGDEQRIAHEAAESMFGTSCEFTKFVEGTEKQSFWDALGGKQKYQDVLEIVKSDEMNIEREPRLFRLFNIRGSVEVEEVYDFTQDDLIGDDVFFLDVYSGIYIWVGKGSRRDERTMANKYLADFIKPSGRTLDNVLVYTVPQGREPVEFKAYFGAWEDHRSDKMTYEDMKKMALNDTTHTTASKYLDLLDDTEYTYEQLTTNCEDLPESVDLTKKELYLSKGEFQSLFGMSKEEFYDKPPWKQIELKKRVNLF